MECVHLLAQCGTRYRIAFDPAYSPRHVPRSMLDPWYMLIPGKFGTIYPTGGYLLRVDIDHHPSRFRKIAALPGCVLVQDGDHEKTLEFHVDLLERVARIVKSRRRRVLTEERRRELVARGIETRYSASASRTEFRSASARKRVGTID